MPISSKILLDKVSAGTRVYSVANADKGKKTLEIPLLCDIISVHGSVANIEGNSQKLP